MPIETFKNKLISYSDNDLLRARYITDDRSDNKIVCDGKALINFCSNDYLGLSMHSDVKKAFILGVEKYGFGSGSSALISGYFKPQKQLEDSFSDFLNRDRALLFNSGYHANLAVMSTIGNRESAVISDKLCHASLLDGIRLSKAKRYRFYHNNIDHAELLIHLSQRKCLLVTESVFSMEGDISPIDKLANIAKETQSFFIVDDAHGIGILGKNGGGISEYFHLTQNDIPCLITPLGKAIGSIGAIVSGESALIESLIQFSNTYRYSTSLPPAIACATLESLNLLKKENWRREKLQKLITFFIDQANHRSLPLISSDLTPIKSILIGKNKDTIGLKKLLHDQGFFISCIRPPTVAPNTARIRISLNCMHEEKDIIHLLDLLADYYEKLKQINA
ncbi:MAG: 8-amino-7-oxononanoate synthase [Gammaproteobacteria bacterium RIFCSPHIGHO2_12_FULL_37_14]|nr:MAG: 8-amino-7-oxononanoate synthase [Gammaproteobacteria bacterium RIFCSPHIGHO2_12_FULL_37_14]